MDVEREGAIPLAELGDIARTVQETMDRIVRALNDREGRGRPPDALKHLSMLEAVAIAPGSAVLEIEAPHDTAQFPIDFDAHDSGVQAVELFVDSLDALARGDELPEAIGRPAGKSMRGFLRAVSNHRHVEVRSSVGQAHKTTSFVPRIVLDPQPAAPEPPVSRDSIEMVGRLYAVDIENHVYRVRDDLGRRHRIRIGDDLDDRELARLLIGETVRVSVEVVDPSGGGVEELTATAVEHVASPRASEYHNWSLDEALEGVEPVGSIRDLAISGLDPDEADAFRDAVND